MVEEKNDSEKQQNSELDSQGIAKVPEVPAIVPTPESSMPPQEVGSPPSAQKGHGSPAKPPTQTPPRGTQLTEPSDQSNELIKINRDLVEATNGLVRATKWGIIVGAIAALFFWLQFRTMTYQTQIFSAQTISGVANAISTDILTQKQIKTLQQQANASKDSVAAIQGQMREDQRAWIEIAQNEKINFMEGQTLHTSLHITNIGKTAARSLFTEAVIQLLPINTEPSLSFRKGIPRTIETSGILFPSPADPINVDVIWGKVLPGQHEAEKVILSRTDIGLLNAGQTYVAIYAITKYVDIFGVPHISKFCTFGAPVGIGVPTKKCSDYNGVDNN